MAAYLYKCKVCGKTFEKRRPINGDNVSVTCPNGHTQVQRIYTAPHVIYRGSGFYVNDSRSKSNRT